MLTRAPIAQPADPCIHADPAPSIRALMRAYLDAMDEARVVPAISISGLLLFYFKYLFWVFAVFFLTPILFALSALWWLVCRVLSRPFCIVGRPVLRYAASPFTSIHNGEVPLLKLVVLRSVVQFLLVRHMKKRMRQLRIAIATFQARHELDSQSMSGVLEREATIVTHVDSTLNYRTLLGRLVVIPPIITILIKTAESLHIDLGAIFAPLTRPLNSGGSGGPDQLASTLASSGASAVVAAGSVYAPAVAYIGPIATILAVLFLLACGCFIVKRELLRRQNAYQIEGAMYRALKVKRPVEFPFDLVAAGMGLVLMIFGAVATMLGAERGDRSSRDVEALLVSDAIPLFIYLLPLVYALIRRCKMRNT
jgi:hypothetical protein